MTRKSDETYWFLMRDGLRAGSVGADRAIGIREKDRDGEAPAKVLRLVSSNKDWRARPKASNARLDARQPLMLVWSDGHLVTAGRSKARR